MSPPRPSVPIDWRPRSTPLRPRGLAVAGADARRLIHRLCLDERRSRLSGVAAGGLVILLGAADDLPWSPGVTYLGSPPAAPSLLLPTTLEATVPEALLEAACRRRDLAAPVVVLPPGQGVGPALVSLAAARPLDVESLRRWLREGTPV